MTNEDRILDAIRRFPDRDDDELSAITGVKPRQQVNQICHALAKRGLIQRIDRPGYKIVNRIRG